MFEYPKQHKSGQMSNVCLKTKKKGIFLLVYWKQRPVTAQTTSGAILKSDVQVLTCLMYEAALCDATWQKENVITNRYCFRGIEGSS